MEPAAPWSVVEYLLLLLGVIGALATMLGVGLWILVSPVRRVVGPPPADLRATSVDIDVGDVRIGAWYAPPESAKVVVLLLHQYRGDRRAMLGRARMLRAHGYGVLMPDLRAHGESGGPRVTFGVRERDDVAALIRWIRATNPGVAIGAIGWSLGGAALATCSELRDLRGVVLEAVFPTFRHAVRNRLALVVGRGASWLTPVGVVLLSWLAGVPLGWMTPEDDLAREDTPALLIGGLRDRRTTVDELRGAAVRRGRATELWAIDAAHEDFHRAAGTDYERRVLDFFARCLDGAPV